jgi:hypothetical protein
MTKAKAVIHAYADEHMDMELFSYKTNEMKIPNIVSEVESKTTQWKHILITYLDKGEGYIGISAKHWH